MNLSVLHKSTAGPALPSHALDGPEAWFSAGLDEQPASVDECRHVFGSVPFLLTVLGEHDVAALAPLAYSRNLVAGTTVFYEDDQTDAVYFIARGAVEIFKSDSSGKKLPLTILRDSGLLGEMGLLTNAPRTATARTLCGVRVLYFKSTEFYQALMENNLSAFRMVLGFARILSQRLSAMDERLFSLFEHEIDTSLPQMEEFKHRMLSVWTGLSLDPNSP